MNKGISKIIITSGKNTVRIFIIIYIKNNIIYILIDVNYKKNVNKIYGKNISEECINNY
jgi:hypothetical protein